jgi:hypothetical protein
MGANALQATLGHEAVHAANQQDYTTMYVLDNSQFEQNSEYAAYMYQAQVSQANYSAPASQANAYSSLTGPDGASGYSSEFDANSVDPTYSPPEMIGYTGFRPTG